ncbi:BTB-domain-containing protein [Rhizophagus irregularis]|uniref:BTB-domain-containing protein n=1 Tax=Rhizophagus irregularis TaxID=588596 RepID=A0A2I1GLU1_9GLOM|nr:BTB-domain-containing protein [Rhizophagus irregularis]
MSAEFFSKLSQNYIELLKDDEYYDITIEVGEDPNVKIFRAHMNILCYRSSYFRRALASNKKKDNVLAHIKFPNISPEIFQIILRYIYGGILSLNEQKTSDFLKVLAAADELRLQELVDHLQKYLIENKSEWMEENFEFTQRISLQSNNFVELQQFCANFIAKSPEQIFKSLTSISEKFLISLIKRDDLQMKEIEVWEHVLKWGLAQNSTLVSDPNVWSDDDFKTMENTLQHCLPYVRLFSISSKEFSQKVRPYKKLLNKQLYEDLLNSYLDSDREPTENISLPRSIEIDGIIDSKIVNLNIVSIISRWIDKIDVNYKISHLRELYLPYKFRLLIRGSRDGFTPRKFHTLCDNKHNTVTFIKVRESEEILGGYNPIIWMNSNSWGKTQNSFIFSFKNRNNFKDAILSIVKDTNNALNYHTEHGPCFGKELLIYTSEDSADIDFDKTICHEQKFYEKSIRKKGNFQMEDYETFLLINDCVTTRYDFYTYFKSTTIYAGHSEKEIVCLIDDDDLASVIWTQGSRRSQSSWTHYNSHSHHYIDLPRFDGGSADVANYEKQVMEGNAKRDAELTERQGIDKEIDDLIPKEPANVPDSVIAQLKQCKPDCKINNTSSKLLEDRDLDAFLDEVQKKKESAIPLNEENEKRPISVESE